jgi:uncharacterized membrane protein
MRHLAFRPSLEFRGRTFKGLRGWSGKPLHPPLTDIPVGAYVLAAAFDVISAVGHDESWARDFYRAASFALIGGAAVSVLAALTGFWDWLRATEPGTQARRTANAHAWTMVTVTVIVLVGIAVRGVAFWDETSTPGIALALTVVAAGLTALGATIGGSLVFDYGFNVETPGDAPVWHRSEHDILPGTKDPERVVDLTSDPARVGRGAPVASDLATGGPHSEEDLWTKHR